MQWFLHVLVLLYDGGGNRKTKESKWSIKQTNKKLEIEKIHLLLTFIKIFKFKNVWLSLLDRHLNQQLWSSDLIGVKCNSLCNELFFSVNIWNICCRIIWLLRYQFNNGNGLPVGFVCKK